MVPGKSVRKGKECSEIDFSFLSFPVIKQWNLGFEGCFFGAYVFSIFVFSEHFKPGFFLVVYKLYCRIFMCCFIFFKLEAFQFFLGRKFVNVLIREKYWRAKRVQSLCLS